MQSVVGISSPRQGFRSSARVWRGRRRPSAAAPRVTSTTFHQYTESPGSPVLPAGTVWPSGVPDVDLLYPRPDVDVALSESERRGALRLLHPYVGVGARNITAAISDPVWPTARVNMNLRRKRFAGPPQPDRGAAGRARHAACAVTVTLATVTADPDPKLCGFRRNPRCRFAGFLRHRALGERQRARPPAQPPPGACSTWLCARGRPG
jgi:hypothetical protein